MNIVFTPTAWEQYTEWQREDKKMVKRINELIKDIDRNGLLIMVCMFSFVVADHPLAFAIPS